MATPLVSTIPIHVTPSITKSKFKPIPKNPSSNLSIKTCKTMVELQQVYCQLTKHGLIHNPSNVTNLITTSLQMGNPENLVFARKTFDFFRKDGGTMNATFMCNSLIKGYAFSGIGNEGVLLFVKMACEGVTFDNYTFPVVLTACTKISGYGEGIQVHGLIIKMGFREDVFIENSLIHFYCECGNVSFGRKVFDEMFDRNVVSYTSLICGYARGECPKEAVSLFFEMVEKGIRPNDVTMVCVISACGKLRDLDLGNKVCSYVGDLELKGNMVIRNALVDMYMKCGAVDDAMKLYEKCVDRDLVMCNTILSYYVHEGMVREAFAIFNEMLRHGQRPDRVTLLSAISVCTQYGNVVFGKSCHGHVLRNGLEHWDSICNALIDMYMKCGQPETGNKVFERMGNKNVVSWNSLIAGLIRNGDVDSALGIFNEMSTKSLVSWNTVIGALVQESMFQEAVQLFSDMQSEGVQADKVTMASVASACGYLGALDLAKWVLAYLKKNEIDCDMKLGTALVDMFARCGDVENAMQIFNEMPERDVSAWTAAIGAMAMEGNGKRAIEVFNEMLIEGGKPDEIVFVALLTACSHGGLVQQGLHMFNDMKKKYGISPQIVHHGCIVDLLGRAGLLKEALDHINNMPMEPNDVVWCSLLSACRKQKNVELASYAAEKLTKLTPNRTGTRVLLSNTYAAAGKWSDVARVRLDMKKSGFRKLPGTSFIEANMVLHEFTSNDESHPEKSYIVEMLNEMNCRLIDAGHVHDLTNVLIDVDEREKEFLLSRHSEKLAIAFGLINTGHGQPIRVVKNLRMCSDCHSFAKMVSKIYERKIVIRDNNRFHIFQHGVCSCTDYW